MCGRFTLTIPDYDSLARALGVDTAKPELASGGEPGAAALYRPRWNVAPTDSHWLLRKKDGRRELMPAKWGLVNRWSKDASRAPRQINARVETVRTTPAFREAFAKRRCVIPADGFYEWVGGRRQRKPVWFHPPPGERLLRLAGVYESWRDPWSGTWQRTFSILTTPANEVVERVHDRMPAILAPEDVDAWLSPLPEGESDDVLLRVLRPARPDALLATFVSARVNSVQNDDPSCLEPAGDPDAMPLFLARAVPPGKERAR